MFLSFWSVFKRKFTLYHLQVEIRILVHYNTPLPELVNHLTLLMILDEAIISASVSAPEEEKPGTSNVLDDTPAWRAALLSWTSPATNFSERLKLQKSSVLINRHGVIKNVTHLTIL